MSKAPAANKVPVLETAKLAYRDAWAAARAMPVMIAVVFVVCAAETLLEWIQTGTEQTLRYVAISVLSGLAVSFFMVPFLIAVHRYILRGEVTARYRIEIATARFWRFFYYSVLLALLAYTIFIGALLFPSDDLALVIGTFLPLIVFVFVSVKLILLFPAIALDDRAANWRAAFRGSRGNFWRIFAVCLLMLLPVLPLVALAIMVDPAMDESVQRFSDPGRLAATLLMGFASFLMQILLVAAASHLFRLLADKMRYDPAASPAGLASDQ